jgi:hypothetical protein
MVQTALLVLDYLENFLNNCFSFYSATLDYFRVYCVMSFVLLGGFGGIGAPSTPQHTTLNKISKLNSFFM